MNRLASFLVIVALGGCASRECQVARAVAFEELPEHLISAPTLQQKFQRFEAQLVCTHPAPTALAWTFREDGFAAAREAGARLIDSDSPAIASGMLSIIEVVAEEDRERVCGDSQIRRALQVTLERAQGTETEQWQIASVRAICPRDSTQGNLSSSELRNELQNYSDTWNYGDTCNDL